VTISRADPHGINGLILGAVFKAPVKTLPTYVGISAAQGYVVVRIEQAQAGKTNDPALATLPVELNQALGQAQQEAVLRALRIQAKVKMLPEASKALAGEAAS
jgi:peptidyl-prolyl cis-trans isomerase D